MSPAGSSVQRPTACQASASKRKIASNLFLIFAAGLAIFTCRSTLLLSSSAMHDKTSSTEKYCFFPHFDSLAASSAPSPRLSSLSSSALVPDAESIEKPPAFTMFSTCLVQVLTGTQTSLTMSERSLAITRTYHRVHVAQRVARGSIDPGAIDSDKPSLSTLLTPSATPPSISLASRGLRRAVFLLPRRVGCGAATEGAVETPDRLPRFLSASAAARVVSTETSFERCETPSATLLCMVSSAISNFFPLVSPSSRMTVSQISSEVLRYQSHAPCSSRSFDRR
mmetsp:Transcript_32060/g.96059  ORF Transcript_32060/g.96059 Transcript_32060/m.96059 type:complete len:282 (+) Transcript_32060:5076-5921(+)